MVKLSSENSRPLVRLHKRSPVPLTQGEIDAKWTKANNKFNRYDEVNQSKQVKWADRAMAIDLMSKPESQKQVNYYTNKLNVYSGGSKEAGIRRKLKFWTDFHATTE